MSYPIWPKQIVDEVVASANIKFHLHHTPVTEKDLTILTNSLGYLYIDRPMHCVFCNCLHHDKTIMVRMNVHLKFKLLCVDTNSVSFVLKLVTS